MKFLVVGNVLGDFEKLNQYIDRVKPNYVLCVGNFGVIKPGSKLPKYFIGDLTPLISNKIQFKVPVYFVRGPKDNVDICHKLPQHSEDIPKLDIKNLYYIPNGDVYSFMNVPGDSIPISCIRIAGLGGTYSTNNFGHKLIDYNKYFTSYEVEEIKNKGNREDIHILLMNDLIENFNKHEITFNEKLQSLFSCTNSFYCFLGNYHWWGKSKLCGTNIVSMPTIDKGYVVLDTSKEWDAEAVRFDIIGGVDVNR
jgi:hypothetical protein